MTDSYKQEVLIIGGGVVGLSIARELKKKGIGKITVLERGEIGKEASYAAGGMLAPHAEADKFDTFFDFCRESLNLYPNFAAELFDETGVDVELDKAGTLYLAFTERDLAEIRARYDWQKSAGLEVEKLSLSEIRKMEPLVSPHVLEGLSFPHDWQVENRKLLAALQRFCRLNQVEIIDNTEVTKLFGEKGKVKGAETKAAKFFAQIVILATGAWTSLIQTDAVSLPQVKPVRGQMIEFRTDRRLFSKIIYSPRGYLIPRQDGRILIGATSHDAGFDKSISDFDKAILQERAWEIAPGLVNLEISESWTGLRPFAADGLPIIGEIAENLWAATAHYRNGILLAPATAKILAEKIAGGTSSQYFAAFSPNRFRSLRIAR